MRFLHEPISAPSYILQPGWACKESTKNLLVVEPSPSPRAKINYLLIVIWLLIVYVLPGNELIASMQYYICTSNGFLVSSRPPPTTDSQYNLLQKSPKHFGSPPFSRLSTNHSFTRKCLLLFLWSWFLCSFHTTSITVFWSKKACSRTSPANNRPVTPWLRSQQVLDHRWEGVAYTDTITKNYAVCYVNINAWLFLMRSGVHNELCCMLCKYS